MTLFLLLLPLAQAQPQSNKVNITLEVTAGDSGNRKNYSVSSDTKDFAIPLTDTTFKCRANFVSYSPLPETAGRAKVFINCDSDKSKIGIHGYGMCRKEGKMPENIIPQDPIVGFTENGRLFEIYAHCK